MSLVLSSLENISFNDIYKAAIQKYYYLYILQVHRGRYKHSKHTRLICDTLERVERGEINRVMFFLPPRHSKSMTISETFPSYYIMKNPNRRVITVSYSEELAQRFGRLNREKINEYGWIFNVSLSDYNKNATNWSIKGAAGGMISTGIGGSITGEGADCLIIDDPIKNYREAMSRTIRDFVWHEWESTLMTRLSSRGAVIIVCTRWHEDDLVGRILENDDSWTIINLPALAEEGDILGREIGEPLWPEGGFTKEILENKRKEIGSRAWNALYQQRPTALEGDIFNQKWFRYYTIKDIYYELHGNELNKKVLKEKCQIIQICDPAATTSEQSDYFVLGTFAITPDKELLVLDIFRERVETINHLKILTSQYHKWKADYIGIESVSFGLSLIQQARATGLPIRPLKADKDKIARARSASARYEAGSIYHPTKVSWLGKFEEEILDFPNAEHDDQVDVLSYASAELIKERPKIRVKSVG